MSDVLDSCLAKCDECGTVFAKFLSPNDTGLTGGHQCGIYIPKRCVPLIFDGLFDRGQNQKRQAWIIWQDGRMTYSTFTYYGSGTRNEYRITSFGRGFPYLKPNHTGDLVIICKEDAVHYWAYELSTEYDIESFLARFDVIPSDLTSLLKHNGMRIRVDEDAVYRETAASFGGEFPDTATMARTAELIEFQTRGRTASSNPDRVILEWNEVEYRLFRAVEDAHYSYLLERPAQSVDEFVRTGLEITNRRKARAGKSLEYHLASVFDALGLSYTAQAITEDRKKPDFLFPSEEAYHDPDYPASGLVFLGAKTTCKDRWRQVLNEADRIPRKYLFTLQQGVSPYQLQEMWDEHLTLVVPADYHAYYPKGYSNVITFAQFIDVVRKATRHS